MKRIKLVFVDMAGQFRITNIEWLRVIAMVAIVLMHIDACYTYTLLPATRFAVPFFFMVTGYFIGEQSKKKDWKKYIIHALLLLLGATLLYGAFEFAGCLYSGRSMCTWQWAKIFIKWIFFNVNPFHYHLWFLGAYLYVIILGACIDKFNLWRWIYWLIIPLLIARFSIQYTDLPPYITRNFLFIGLPCFLMGSWLRKNQSLCVSHLTNGKFIWVCLVTAILPFGEDYIWENILGVQYGDFITSYILAFLLLLAAVELPSVLQRYLPSNARSLVLGIYIIHPMVQIIYTHILPQEALILYNTWLAPVVVFITSWLVCDITLRAVKIWISATPTRLSKPSIQRRNKPI